MSRLMSRFAMPRSEESRMESLADPSRMGDIDENDPKSVARMMKRMGKEMGDEFGGPEFDEAVEELERGGDLGDDDLGGGSDGDGDRARLIGTDGIAGGLGVFGKIHGLIGRCGPLRSVDSVKWAQ